jgi:serine protease Do
MKSVLSLTLALTLLVAAPCRCDSGNQSNINLQQSSNDFTFVAKKAIPSVVSIKVRGKLSDSRESRSGSFGYQDPFDFFNDDFWNRFFDGQGKQSEGQIKQGQGSGFIVTADGYIITNNHVVKDADTITVILNDGKEYSAKLIGHDPNTDIAVVKIDAKNLPFLKLGNSDQLEIGQWVVAIGNPLGLQASLTAGIVNAKNRNNLALADIEDFIQTDAVINQGNSGGPLLNLNAEVVGVNTAIATNTGGYMGIGFAIPSNIAKFVMDQLIAKGNVSRGYLGVTLQKVDSDLAQAFGLEKVEGALVADVAKDSPAEKAGIKQGDVILKINQQLVDSIAALRNAISFMEPQTPVTLTLLRDGKTFDSKVIIGSYPNHAETETLGTKAHEEVNALGFEVADLTPDIAKRSGYENEKGVVITKVQSNSPAALVGLTKGVIILAVNHQKIASKEEFYSILKKSGKEKPLLLLVRQGNTTRFISIKMGG